MKYLIATLITLILSTHHSFATFMLAEDSPDRYIRTTSTKSGIYYLECIIIKEKVHDDICFPLLQNNRDIFFTTAEVDELSDRFLNDQIKTWIAKVAVAVAGVPIGGVVGYNVVAAAYPAENVAAGLGAAIGAVLNSTINITLSAVFDLLDGSTYRDIAYANKAVLDTANENELEKIEVTIHENGELIVTVKELAFGQLRTRMIKKLEEILDER